MAIPKGQASLEGLLVLPLGILTVSLLFWAIAVGWSYLWSRYHFYEAVICLQDQNPNTCQQQFHKKMRSTIPYVQIDFFVLQKNRFLHRGQCRLRISFLGEHKIEMQKSIPR